MSKLECPKCEEVRKFRTYQTQAFSESILRIKECQHCFSRYETEEKITEERRYLR